MTRRHLRRGMGGTAMLLLAALVLFARLVGGLPVLTAAQAADQAADQVAQVALDSICHPHHPGDKAPGPAHKTPAHDLACPLSSGAAAPALLQAAAVPAPPTARRIRAAASPPPATGPPGRPIVLFRPTGPPALRA